MPNHVHLIALPKTENGLRRAIGEAHRRYTRRINFREKWRGYLWQGRFASFIMDEPYLLAAARYVELNPVRARLVERPGEWPWSSARGAPQRARRPLGQSRASAGDGWRLERLFEKCDKRGRTSALAEHSRTGRPLGDCEFGPFGESCWSGFETAKTRSQAETSQAANKISRELGNVSPFSSIIGLIPFSLLLPPPVPLSPLAGSLYQDTMSCRSDYSGPA